MKPGGPVRQVGYRNGLWTSYVQREGISFKDVPKVVFTLALASLAASASAAIALCS
jgi:hypothetical protein